MWGVRTLNLELFCPIHEILLHDGKNFYHVGESNPRGGGGGAFWQKLGGDILANYPKNKFLFIMLNVKRTFSLIIFFLTRLKYQRFPPSCPVCHSFLLRWITRITKYKS